MTVQMWDKKYRPKKVENYIFQSESEKELIEKWIQERTVPDLLLTGHRGTGKSSLAYLLRDEIGVDEYDWLKINASDDNGINIIRNRVKTFISGMAVGDTHKLVLLDEADAITPEAQESLKSMMEDFSDNARFILTSNKPHRIIPELRSRCKEIAFSGPNKLQMTERFIEILAEEKVKGLNLALVQEYVDAFYPDFRTLLINAQQGIKNNKLVALSDLVSDTTEFMVKIIEFLEKDDWVSSREYLSKNVPDDKWDECYRFLYEYLGQIGKFQDTKKWKLGIITIGDHLYKHASVADAEINFAACLAKLSEI